MKALVQRFLVLFIASLSFTNAGQAQDAAEVGQTLDDFHAAAAAGDWNAYFSLWNDDGVFLGTDAGERWELEEFQAYAERTSGWVYTPQQRNINFTPDGNTAWFDEILLSQNYGTSRGTGVLVKTEEGWRVSQYHLVFPIPNALADRFTDEIKAYEAGQQ